VAEAGHRRVRRAPEQGIDITVHQRASVGRILHLVRSDLSVFSPFHSSHAGLRCRGGLVTTLLRSSKAESKYLKQNLVHQIFIQEELDTTLSLGCNSMKMELDPGPRFFCRLQLSYTPASFI
jgi:hypothetical protein